MGKSHCSRERVTFWLFDAESAIVGIYVGLLLLLLLA